MDFGMDKLAQLIEDLYGMYQWITFQSSNTIQAILEEQDEDPNPVVLNPHYVLLNSQSTATDSSRVSARVYNNHYNPLGQLPEELLLRILYFASDDVASIFCLRRASSTFRRLIAGDDLSRFSPSTASFFSPEDLSRLEPYKKGQIRRLLQIDGMCDDCKLWCDVPVEGWYRRLRQCLNLRALRRRPESYRVCNFKSLPQKHLYCHACHMHHNGKAFSYSNQASDLIYRECLGREGAVRLCEHVQISWAQIENHIVAWRKNKSGDWQECFDDFYIECRDLTHTCCVDQGVPVYPHARLRNAVCNPNLVILELRSHGGLDLTTLPQHRNRCSCDHSEIKVNDDRLLHIIPSNRKLICSHCDGCRGVFQFWGYGKEGERDIAVYSKKDGTFVNPTHAWLHAMDPDTFERPTRDIPLCKNGGCMNYYRRPKSSDCVCLFKNGLFVS
ncbi:hypothetical protein F4821DRAFT_227378 [Hypoxylon rubiginosum]|uniref:Uncharacterized protein n=1 Tax=Hypoxylon rubiginosum TaxID=110542 RepID=A0ACC0DEA7_9PEZI|nr:hypothetical protein F4821DRAFT_227378 [Hypoxylon rubiginosum]